MNDFPAPLVPSEVDLRDYPFTPLFRARLFGSSFHARSTDAEWRAGVTLWLKSWDQVPAGTLPTDDIDLCRLAELGRDHKAWHKVKAMALHGWVECSDRRLHHAVVAEGVLDAWEKRRRQSTKGAKGAAEKWRKHNEAIAQVGLPNGTGTVVNLAQAMPKQEIVSAQAMPNDSKERERDKEEKGLPPLSPPRKRKGQGVGRRLDQDWKPTPEDQQFALSRGLDAGRIAEEFRDYWIAKPGAQGRKLDWSATWRNWVRRAAERDGGRLHAGTVPERHAPSGPPPSLRGSGLETPDPG